MSFIRKCGFVRVGEDIVVNEKMTLVDYVKNCIRVRRMELRSWMKNIITGWKNLRRCRFK